MGSKPHILMLAPLFPPFKGAAASRVHSFARYWSPLTKVTVVAPEHTSGEGGYQRITFPLTKWRSDFLRIPSTFPKLLRLARQLNPDVIFTSIPPVWPLLEGSLLAKRLGVPLILDVRDLPAADVRAAKTSLFRKVLRSLTISIARHNGRKASRIVTVTDWFKKELLKFLAYPANRIFVIRNGSDTGFFRDALSAKKEFDIVYSGTLIYIRNPEGVLKYLRALADLYPRLRVLFISNLNETTGREFLSGVRDFNLSNNIVTEDMCEPKELPRRLGRARLGLSPLRCGYQTYQGVVGAKDYEYLAAGLPVIGLLDPDFYIETRHLIADNKTGILNPFPERLAIETAALLKDPVRLCRMSKQARKVGERFDRKRLAEDYYYKVILPAWQEFNAGRRISK